MVAACALVMNLQTIVSRPLSPADTRGASGPEISDAIEAAVRSIVRGTAETYGLTAEVRYTREFVPLLNDPALTGYALAAAEAVFGADNVSVAEEPMTASEDFAQFLRHVPLRIVLRGEKEDMVEPAAL